MKRSHPAPIHPILLLTLLLGCVTPVTATPPDAEHRLLQAIEAMQSRRLDQAVQQLEGLTDELPNFRLAQLVLGDALGAQGVALQGIGTSSPSPDSVLALAEEAQARWRGRQRDPETGRIPRELLRLDPAYKTALLVDLARSRLYVFDVREGVPELVEHTYISMGKAGPRKQIEGDNRTPLGVYFVDSYIPGEKLPDLYGVGAYPINYPNAWDKLQGRTGHGIWLHGTPRATYSRPPRTSEGCVVLNNSDLTRIGKRIDLRNTPVIIGTGFQWLDRDSWYREQQTFAELWEQWRNDWESLDVDRFLGHYSREFDNGNKDYKGWSAHKKRISGHKKFIRVQLEDVSQLRYPDSDLMVITYTQDYRSSNYSSRSRKRQYWKREDDGRWRIVFEGLIPGSSS